MSMQAYARPALLSFIASVGVFVWVLPLFSTSFESNILRIVFLDVKQSDAIFIESPLGEQLLIDGGTG